MQIRSLRIKAYRSWAVDERTPAEAVDRLRKLELMSLLLEEGCSQATALEVVGWSRATYSPWRARFEREGLRGLVTGSRRPCRVRQPQWTRQHEQLVWGLRRRFPTRGKRPIRHVLVRDHGVLISESTVGRILAKGIRLGRIHPAWTARGGLRALKRRARRPHACRWCYGMAGRRPGELVQIDHMTVRFPDGREIKEFKAICPVSKQLVTRAYSRATAHNAQRYQDHYNGYRPHQALDLMTPNEYLASPKVAA